MRLDVVRRFKGASVDTHVLADSVRRLADVLEGPGPNAQRLVRAVSDLGRLPPTPVSADLIERFITALDTAARWFTRVDASSGRRCRSAV
jgi:hypothetical protein